MKLSNALAMIPHIIGSLQMALWPTLRELLHKPSLFLSPASIRRIFMAHLWKAGCGDGIDMNESPNRKALITPNAYGVVLDVGAGHGHLAKYLDREKVMKYVATEPNTAMHAEIRKHAAEVGFTEADGSLVVLPYGAEQTSLISSAMGTPQAFDTLVSIGCLCSVPKPAATVKTLVEQLLKPGGQLLYIEHVRSPRADVAWWQAFWTPVWVNIMDGCRLAQPTDVWIDELEMWETREPMAISNQDEEIMFWRRMGRYVKQA
ncbi:hypothetical protein EIP86_000085 [Pleurotus ostreatoroseus]|nr:hypothetical protein EIP86_000085 [Pleurotus ostreatoroseus]